MDSWLRKTLLINKVRIEMVDGGCVRLSGSLTDESDREKVAAHLRELHDRIVALRRPSLAVDVRGLSFVNSSAVRLFVDLATRAQSAGYTLTFDIDSSVTWHRLSFSALRLLAPAAVVLRDHAPTGTGDSLK